MNTTSSLYRELTRSELDSIVAKHFSPRTLQSARLLKGGLFNTTYLLELSDGLRLVLRVGPINRQLLMPFEENMMAAEAHVYTLCRARGVPVSDVLALDVSHTLIDRDFMCVAYIPSAPLSELQLDPADKTRLYCQTGRLTRQLHEITGPRFGRVSQLLTGGGYDHWRDAILGEIAHWKRRAVPVSLFSPAEFAEIDSLFSRFAPLFDEIKTPRLVHADLWAGNVLVTGSGSAATVAAIIDADRALFGDVDFEFASPWMINDAFVQGYGSAPDTRRESTLRRRLYALIYNLLDCYVWLHQYNNAENSASNRQSALEKIEQLRAE